MTLLLHEGVEGKDILEMDGRLAPGILKFDTGKTASFGFFDNSRGDLLATFIS